MLSRIFLLFCMLLPAAVWAQHLLPVAEGFSKTSVNATIFRSSSLVTHRGVQYVAYYDSACYLVLGKRRQGSVEWEFRRSQYAGNCADAHNIISMMVDGQGYLHLAFDHHSHPLRYCRSKAPESLELGEKMPMLGEDEDKVTYPEFYRLANGNLIFVYRSGSSGRGNMVMNLYHADTKKWERVQSALLDGEGQRNAYWQQCVDVRGAIHLSWVWRETADVASNHDLCYARSTDGGRTWEKSTGEKYVGSITQRSAEYVCRIPQNSELINQTSMAADGKGNPYIATYWRSAGSRVPQYRLLWHDGKAWRQQQVSNRATPFSLSGGGTKKIPIARPRLAVDTRGSRPKAYYIFRDEERGSKVSLAYTDNLHTGVWRYRDLTDFSVDAWEPTYDTELWQQQHELQLFVQKVGQGDGEKVVQVKPQMIYVLEVATSTQSLQADSVELLIHRVNEYWQRNNPTHGNSFWHRAAYHTGNMEAYFATGKPEYLAYSQAWAEHNEWKGAKSNNKEEWKYTYGEKDQYVLFGDFQTCFQVYADLYGVEPAEHKIARAREVMEYQMSTKFSGYWWWADGLYMVMPVMTRLYKFTNNSLYLEKLHEYFAYADSIMYDAEAGLYYRDAKYVYPKHKTVNGRKDFWARGDGWVFAAFARVLADLPSTNAHRAVYEKRFRAMAKAVAASQQAGGYWTRSMLDSAHAPGPETSGTAFFTYGLLWGMNNGLLPEAEYAPVVEKAWKYLTIVALQPSGKLGYVQPIGEKAIQGQVVNADSQADFGVGAYLLAACEMMRYRGREK